MDKGIKKARARHELTRLGIGTTILVIALTHPTIHKLTEVLVFQKNKYIFNQILIMMTRMMPTIMSIIV